MRYLLDFLQNPIRLQKSLLLPLLLLSTAWASFIEGSSYRHKQHYKRQDIWSVVLEHVVSQYNTIGTEAPVEDYQRHPNIDPNLWEELRPYFLPTNHPLRPKLDKIFKRSRASYNQESLKKAGFSHTGIQRYSNIVVAKHKKLKGYLVKLFTDTAPDRHEWMQWKRRIDGAHAISEAIQRHNYQNWLTVPNKWIYPLPIYPAVHDQEGCKYFVLIVEDMRILRKRENLNRWRSEAMHANLLAAIYGILQEVGLDDSIFPWNTPFRKNGSIAFIDTERFHRWPVHMYVLKSFLSPEMVHYLNYLIKTHGP